MTNNNNTNTEAKQMVNFTKTTKAESYSWAGIGNKSSSTAAEYACHVDGKLVAVITRASGGGFMEPVFWEARATNPMKDMFGKLHPAGRVVLTGGKTLKIVKENLTAKFSN
tara:strand:- start:3296 stop:3628 length:333 start_codon:yes stop_codon:yes gene_type:complete